MDHAPICVGFLQEKGQPACPEVIRAITKSGGLSLAQGRALFLTSNEPGLLRETQVEFAQFSQVLVSDESILFN